MKVWAGSFVRHKPLLQGKKHFFLASLAFDSNSLTLVSEKTSIIPINFINGLNFPSSNTQIGFYCLPTEVGSVNTVNSYFKLKD